VRFADIQGEDPWKHQTSGGVIDLETPLGNLIDRHPRDVFWGVDPAGPSPDHTDSVTGPYPWMLSPVSVSLKRP